MPQKKHKQEDSLRHLELDTMNASSSTDCTGLLPFAPKSEAEQESYREIYDYQAEIRRKPDYREEK